MRRVGTTADYQELEHLKSPTELIKAKIEEQIQPVLSLPEELAKLIHQGRQCKQPSQSRDLGPAWRAGGHTRHPRCLRRDLLATGTGADFAPYALPRIEFDSDALCDGAHSPSGQQTRQRAASRSAVVAGQGLSHDETGLMSAVSAVSSCWPSTGAAIV